MRTITRKTNVRQHKRNTKNKEANVKQHLRKVVRPIAGVFALKDMNWKQSKRIFPMMKPDGDWDGDGVRNKKDCRPFDVERQHDMQEFIDSIDVSDEEVRMAGELYEDEKKYGDRPDNEGGLFTTPQKELEKGSWDILTGKRK